MATKKKLRGYIVNPKEGKTMAATKTVKRRNPAKAKATATKTANPRRKRRKRNPETSTEENPRRRKAGKKRGKKAGKRRGKKSGKRRGKGYKKRSAAACATDGRQLVKRRTSRAGRGLRGCGPRNTRRNPDEQLAWAAANTPALPE